MLIFSKLLETKRESQNTKFVLIWDRATAECSMFSPGAISSIPPPPCCHMIHDISLSMHNIIIPDWFIDISIFIIRKKELIICQAQ